MDLEGRLRKLNAYDVSFEIKQGYYHVALRYCDGWNVLDVDNPAIYVQEKNGVHHYIAEADSVGLDDIFNCIDATIEYNIDLQMKIELFKEKTCKLQELFSTEDYDTLKTIEFKVTRKKPSEKKEKETKKTKAKAKKPKASAKRTKKDITAQGEPQPDTSVPDYDSAEEIVEAKDGYIEELERK